MHMCICICNKHLTSDLPKAVMQAPDFDIQNAPQLHIYVSDYFSFPRQPFISKS